jgi:tetratricopeptide (TPR) repeat protein
LYENQLTTLPATICNLKNLITVGFSKNPVASLPECFKNMGTQRPLYEVAEEAAASAQPDSAFLAMAKQLLGSTYQDKYERTLKAVREDTTNAHNYFNLSFYALFVGEYPMAIKAAQKTLSLSPESVNVATNLALGYLMNNQYEQAEVIYKKWMGKKFEDDDDDTANDAFLKDIADLENAGITHPDFAKVKVLLKKQE